MPKKWVLQRADFGGYDSLDFYNLQGAVIPFSYDDATQEIITLSLDQAIQSGSSGVFTIKYALDIPKNISRGGHLNQSYQMTQWYPKVALLDSSGWHTMHYLEYGEFFNDFGDYRVKRLDSFKDADSGARTKVEHFHLHTMGSLSREIF